MKEIFFFSQNRNKINEVLNAFEGLKIKILTLNEYPLIKEPEEIGKSFDENAKIKSSFGFKNFNMPCFADDSGLCIKALNNMPGIKSKRYTQINGGIKKTLDKIIKETKLKNNNDAFFQTSIALTVGINKTFFFEGIIEGNISPKPLGKQGFHYDPIFVPRGYDKTFAQMTLNEKNKISHRGIALKKLVKFLASLV